MKFCNPILEQINMQIERLRKENPDGPVTVSKIEKALKNLGVKEGMTLIVHSSLSEIGCVCGGPVAVIIALENVLTSNGTLVMPTHSTDLSDPSQWCNPPVPEEWVDTIKKEMPPFSPDMTNTRKMGIIPETFRKQDGVIRSYHPQVSFAAWGKHKEDITSNHSLNYGCGENSPLAKIYELDGHILLLGVTNSSNTSLHLSEYRASYNGKKTEKEYSPILENGQRVWKEFIDINLDSDDFECLGNKFLATHEYKTAKIGNADSFLIKQRDIVDFGVKWLEANRM